MLDISAILMYRFFFTIPLSSLLASYKSLYNGAIDFIPKIYNTMVTHNQGQLVTAHKGLVCHVQRDFGIGEFT